MAAAGRVVRPHVLLSVAASVDGCIDDTGPHPLALSNDADFDRVDQVRADSDAILVGAGTVRADNPRLLVKCPRRRQERLDRGLPEHPVKVTVTASGALDPAARIWHHGGEKLVYSVHKAAPLLRHTLCGRAEVIALGDGAAVDFGALLDDLGSRGIGRLMVEGGARIHTALLAGGFADEIHYVIAPVLVGQPGAPRFLHSGAFPGGPTRRMHLAEVRAVGDVVLLRYLPKR